jgi:hypothetical protein
MAKNRLTRYLSVLWDRDAARQLQAEADATFQKVAKSGGDEFEQGMKEGGRKAARTLTSHLRREYKIRMARARLELAEGTIDEKAFEREGREAAEAFNKGLTGGIRKLRAQGNFSDLQAAGLAGSFKRVPGGGAAAGVFGRMGGMMGGFAGPLAGIFTATAALNEASAAISAADRLDIALRKLGGTAQITGIPLAQLRGFVDDVRESMGLSEPAAVDLTATMAKLARRAGDVSQTGAAMIAWLDLAAANGVDTATALDALNTTLAGNDEGLNRLGLANPQQIYEKWGAGADQASKDLAILNEILEAGKRAVGAHAAALGDSAGQANATAQRIEGLRAEFGKSLQPIRDATNDLRVGFYEALVVVAGGIGGVVEAWREARRERIGQFDQFGIRLPMDPNSQSTGTTSAPATDPRRASDPLRVWSDQMRAEAADILKRQIAATAAEPFELDPLGEEERKKAREEAVRQAREFVRLMEQLARLEPIDPFEHRKIVGTLPKPKKEHFRNGKEFEFGVFGTDTERVRQGDEDAARFRGLDANEDALRESMERIQEISQEAAYQMSSAFQDAFALMMEEGATFGNFMEGIARGIAGSMLAGLAQYAQGKAAENVAEAIEAGAEALGFTSHGNFPSAAAAWAEVGQRTLAAAAWSALAGGAGAARGAVTGGAGAIPPSSRPAGLDAAERAERRGQPVVVYVDPFNPGNPVHVRQIGKAVELDVRLGGTPEWARGTR